MRYRLRTGLALQLAALLLLCGFIIRLGLAGRLNLYIHPRYIWFTLIMASLGAILLTMCLAVVRRRGLGYSKIHWRDAIAIVPVVIMLTVALVAPQRSLSADAAAQRGLSQQASLAQTQPVQSSSLSQFGDTGGNLSFREWVVVLTSSQDAKTYVGKEAKLSGFVASGGRADADSFYLSRFIVTCCAVDATPIGVQVTARNWRDNYKEGQWLQITAKVEARGSKYVLAPSNIQAIAEPEQPYAN